MIEKGLLIEQGVMRYENDMYDGMIRHTNHVKKGAGSWALLMFRYIIDLEELGRKEEARKKFESYIGRLEDDLIPEQVFYNDLKNSSKPLA